MLCCLCVCVVLSMCVCFAVFMFVLVSFFFVVLYPDVFCSDLLSEGLMEFSLTLDCCVAFLFVFCCLFALLCYHQLPLLCCVMLFCPKD